MDKLIEALKALAEGKGDKDEVAKLLKEHAGAVHQIVFQDGHNVGYGKKAGELKAAEEKATTLTSENTQLKKDLETARQSNPDVAKIHSDYQTQIKDLQTKHEAEKTELKGKLQAKEVAGAKAQVVDALVALGVDREYASTVLVHRDDIASRIKPDATSGEIQFLQAGGTIPIVAAGDKKPAQLLAEEIHLKVEPKWLTASGDRGAGNHQGSPGAPAGAAQLITEIRKEAKDRQAAPGEKTGPGGVPEGISHLAVTGH